MIIPIAVFVVGWPHIRSTVQFTSQAELEDKSILRVVNYNARVFNVYAHLKGLQEEAPLRMIEWLTTQDADVICLQEYYDDSSSDMFNISQRIFKAGYRYSNVKANKENRIGAKFGLAIFSKLPISNRGSVSYGDDQKNEGIYIDVLYNADTLRIYNTHFFSMKLRVQELVKEQKEIRKLVKLKETLRRIKQGFVAHSKETDILKDHVRNSPYPVILTGDFNDVPYSYTYLSFRDFMQNSFEEAGTGFGFTYNQSPSFIRIDHQFSSLDFEVVRHVVHEEIKYSDHYPVSVDYSFQGRDTATF